ncbi:MAG: alpha-mannosidase, partial [Clostridia bacterium]|nr:alpha-mannosidase [Clostridia bacterium]
MEKKYRQIKKYLSLLNDARWEKIETVENIEMYPCGYKTGNDLPVNAPFCAFENGDLWGGGYDKHAWFRFCVAPQGPNAYLRVKTDKQGVSTTNPQFIAYINGKAAQGLDTNHTELLLPETESAEIYLYGYTSFYVENTRLFAEVARLHTDVDGLYYDILYPFESLEFLNKESGEYAAVTEYLYRATSMLSLYDMRSEAFFSSVKAAREYLKVEFYGKYCREQTATTVCIGHTHIDCAWLWTLAQTREKVQRSFSTVLELMKRYPEYKFTSSQALLYEYFKEENPELYAELKERVKEGRWEAEGSMWVEADCNLTSGESLVRQILYGKRFFREEFGVDNRVLWLPDVFGYSAALPQILKKSGVDWFFTSKISWNDTNRMPYDTFLWKGIDGTEIPAYFLTAQQDNGEASKRQADYVGSTGAKWISGAYKRYGQKNLSNEVLLTYGWGDGGGGPTREMLELL